MNRGGPLAGVSGGGSVGRCRWSSIFVITFGSTMAAMIRVLLLQLGQVSRSMLNTRLRSLAHEMRYLLGLSASTFATDWVASGDFGVIRARYLA